MTFLPKDYEGLWTLSSGVSRSGIGLHSGAKSEVHLLPFEKEGFYVSWFESEFPPLLLEPSLVSDSPLCTTLKLGEKRLSTVEHLLAALAGCGLTHVHIKVTGEEIPLLDGSALGWVNAIKEVGLRKISTGRKRYLRINKPLLFHRGESIISVVPAEKFKLIGVIDFPQKVIGKQVFSIELSPEKFVQQIAPARTFGFLDQVENLRSAGLIRGGALDNALVCDGDCWLNPPLRFNNEPVRHKLLDLIGDLSLVGFPQAQILVYKGSHGLHADLARGLLNFSN